MNGESILMEVGLERARQIDLAHGGDTDAFDQTNTKSDWISFIACYAGRGANKVLSNPERTTGFRSNMVKVAALAVAAIEAHDKGWC